MARRPSFCAALAALALVACSSPEGKKTEDKEPKTPVVQALPETDGSNRANVAYFDKLMRIYKKDKMRAAKSFPISISPKASVNYVVITGKVPPHKHARHDEVFIIVAGEGILSVEARDGGIETHEVAAGSIFHIPQGVAHAFQNTGKDGAPTLGINIFSPAYTDDDRIPVTWEKKKTKAKAGN